MVRTLLQLCLHYHACSGSIIAYKLEKSDYKNADSDKNAEK